jgi:tRNA(adenine34) deaminase
MQPDLDQLMRQALQEAREGFRCGEVPVGAVLARSDGGIVARGYNQPIRLNDPTAHAEILALREGALVCGNYRMPETILVVTIEPCLMCMGAIMIARVGHLVFGAPDPKGGAAGSIYNIAADERLNHRIKVTSGVLEDDCRSLMQDFFRMRR